MKRESLKLMLVIIGAIIFNIIFWKEKLGVNTILFDGFIIGCIFYLYPFSVKYNACRWIAAGHLITAAMVVIHNTMLSKIGCSISLMLFISFSQYVHRSVLYAGGSVALNYLLSIPHFFSQLKFINSKSISLGGLSRPIRMLVIPFIIVIVFVVIYTFANAAFSNIASDIISGIQHWFAYFFDWFSLQRFGFFLLGVIVTSGLILKAKSSYFSDADLKQKDILSRKRDHLKKWKASPFSDLLSVIVGKASKGILALKNEYIISLTSLVLLNIILLVNNILDLKYVWLGFTFSRDVSLSAYVHEGAGLLILSIILAMLLLLFFFRGNLNFYKKIKWLQYGAYLWIFQNLFLVVSVFIRDYYYISHYGFAYKRIGLLFFLAMVISGLLSVFIKIYFTKTAYYLLRLNSWVAIFLLVGASTVNWDVMIAKYNLARKSILPIDVPFLLSLSDCTLPIIEKNKDILENNIVGRSTALYFFEHRKKMFLEEQQNYTWLSWNVADAETKKALMQPVISSLKKINHLKNSDHETDHYQPQMEPGFGRAPCLPCSVFHFYCIIKI